MRGLNRVVLARTSAVVFALTLCGCGENYGPIQISEANGKLAVVFCDDQTIESIQVVQAPAQAESSDAFVTLWKATGPTNVAESDVIIVDDRLADFTQSEVRSGFSPDEGTVYEFTVYLQDGSDYGPVFHSPEGGLSEGSWLTTAGRLVDAPCTY